MSIMVVGHMTGTWLVVFIICHTFIAGIGHMIVF